MRLAQLCEASKIKLRGFGQRDDQGDVDEFMYRWEEMTHEHPMKPNARVFGNGVHVEIEPWGSGVHLGDITSLATKGTGEGTKALQALTTLADQTNVTISGVAKAYSTTDGHIQDTKTLAKWYQNNGFKISAVSGSVEIKYHGRSITENQTLPDDIIPDFGVKIGKNARLWRGESKTSGSNGATYGVGLYTTTSRKYAKDFGTVREVPRWEALPDNPVRFKTIMDWELWLQRYDQYHGILGARDRGTKHNDIGDYIRIVFPNVDGVQIGTGNDAIFVAWPVE